MLTRPLFGSMRSMRALVVDNPVLAKDASIAWRAPVTPFAVAAAGIGMFLVAFAVHESIEPSNADLATWGTLHASGRAMFAAITGALLALETLVIPAIASSAIAGERERGTLTLLQVTALSPARIVAGKVLSVLVIAAPVALCAVPLLALAAAYGGVSVLDIVDACGFVIVHGFTLACVGVGASSLVKRGRSAAPLAMIFAVAPSLFAALPAAAVLVTLADGQAARDVGPIAVVGLLIDVVLACASVLLARDQLSQKTTPRWPLRRVVLAAAFALMPIGAALTNGSRNDMPLGPIFAQLAWFIPAVALLEIVIADVRAVDRRTPTKQALIVAALFTAGFVASWLASDELHTKLRAVDVAVVASYALFVSTLAALWARIVRPVAARIVLTLVSIALLFAIAPVLHELHALFGPGWPLGFTNVVAVLDHKASREAGIAFFLVSSALFAVLSRRRAR